MSYSLDANILLYASDQGSPFGEAARDFLQSCAERSEPLCIGWPTLMAYLRIATHSGIFSRPLTPAQAAANVEALLALPQVRTISEGEGFWACFRETVSALPVRGNLIPDAHLAALLLEHDVGVLYTTDADFKKFPALDARNPFG